MISALQQDFYTSNFVVRNVEIVGPQVGSQLRHQAIMATLYSLAGMLVYLWFRFEMIYGVGAVVACLHDTIITVGFFSLLNKEISLTVIAAILTLIGYSMNDTIVVFDRIRENIKLLRREPLADIVNKSINQTLSRTILTSGLTFLTVLSLYIFGGEVLRGFSLALVIGILIGTYSSIAVAAPMLVAYQDWRAKRAGQSAAQRMALGPGQGARKGEGKGVGGSIANRPSLRRQFGLEQRLRLRDSVRMGDPIRRSRLEPRPNGWFASKRRPVARVYTSVRCSRQPSRSAAVASAGHEYRSGCCAFWEQKR